MKQDLSEWAGSTVFFSFFGGGDLFILGLHLQHMEVPRLGAASEL